MLVVIVAGRIPGAGVVSAAEIGEIWLSPVGVEQVSEQVGARISVSELVVGAVVLAVVLVAVVPLVYGVEQQQVAVSGALVLVLVFVSVGPVTSVVVLVVAVVEVVARAVCQPAGSFLSRFWCWIPETFRSWRECMRPWKVAPPARR